MTARGGLLLLGGLLIAAACTSSPEDDATGSADSGTAAGGGEGLATGMQPDSSAGNGDGGPGTGAGSTTTPSGDATGPGDASGTGVDPTHTGTGSTTGGGLPGQVVMETSLGTIVIETYEEESPGTVANFLAYIEAGFYDGSDGLGATVFHRVIPGFVIQGGGLTEVLSSKATMPPIANEFGNGPLNLRGTLSMARTDNPDSATSQFFINVADNTNLDVPPGYAVFGEVVEGMDVVDAIVAVPTTSMAPYENVPVDPILIMSVTVN